MKLRLVTVTGSRTNTLRHMLNHYKNLVDEMFVVVYEWDGESTYDRVKEIVDEFPTAMIVKRYRSQKYNWEKVTKLYNDTKKLFPNDWWVVSDDDEFHIYSQDLNKIISDCECNGWQMVRGGFIDRIGEDGGFRELLDDINIFQQFPVAGFFRHPLSGANPNKVCIMKGSVELLPGQHYAQLDGYSNWRWQGWSHPLIAPINKYNVQVHHFNLSTIFTLQNFFATSKFGKTIMGRFHTIKIVRLSGKIKYHVYKMLYQMLLLIGDIVLNIRFYKDL